MKQKPLFWLHRVAEQTSPKCRDLSPGILLSPLTVPGVDRTQAGGFHLGSPVLTAGVNTESAESSLTPMVETDGSDPETQRLEQFELLGCLSLTLCGLSTRPFQHGGFREAGLFTGDSGLPRWMSREDARWELYGFSESWKSSAPLVGYPISQSSPPDPQVQGEGHRLHLSMKKWQSSPRACGREIFLWLFWENMI